jgi:hypothetical protein
MKPRDSLRACGARPSRGASPLRMAYRGKPGDDLKGGFLGGAHSVRPRREAFPMPRHLIGRDGRAKGPRRNGDVSG